MLNQGPAIHFDPESRKSWAARLELGQRLKGRELQAAYERARPYIAQRVNQLLKMEGWTLVPNNEWVRLTFFLNLREAFPLAPIDFFFGGAHTVPFRATIGLEISHIFILFIHFPVISSFIPQTSESPFSPSNSDCRPSPSQPIRIMVVNLYGQAPG